MPLNVLVLGVGGNVGQGIIKALRLSGLRPRIFGGCIDPASPGLYLADHACLTPLAADSGFNDWLFSYCRAHDIRAVLSGVDDVLLALAECGSRLERETGAVAVVSDSAALRRAHDKLNAAAWLQDQGLPCPFTVPLNDPVAVQRLKDTCGYPLVVKPRYGRGSAGVSVARSDGDLARIRSGRAAGLIVQEYLGGRGGEEFTAACFVDDGGAVRATIAFRRELCGGTTQKAYAGAFPDVRRGAAAVVARLGARGPCNVQMRYRGEQPVCFDINLRFSSTCPIRARMGFNDVDAALQHLVLRRPVPPLNEVATGVALRYLNEVYVDEGLVARLTDERDVDLTGPYSSSATGRVRVEDSGATRRDP